SSPVGPSCRSALTLGLRGSAALPSTRQPKEGERRRNYGHFLHDFDLQTKCNLRLEGVSLSVAGRGQPGKGGTPGVTRCFAGRPVSLCFGLSHFCPVLLRLASLVVNHPTRANPLQKRTKVTKTSMSSVNRSRAQSLLRASGVWWEAECLPYPFPLPTSLGSVR